MQEKLIIEKGIPLPPKLSQKGKKFMKWPFKDMVVDDSVFVPTEMANVNKVISAFQAVERRSKTKISFAFRESENGVRVWRIS